MSYDLDVYTRTSLSQERFRDLVEGIRGLDVDQLSDGFATVVRGARRTYSFTVEGPWTIDGDDVPTEITGAVLGARFQWSVLVEGSDPKEVPHAVRFSRRLAESLDGAVYDKQDDSVWSRSKSRSVARPTRDERTDVVGVHFYCLRDDVVADPARLYLDVVRRHLPEASPHRFGEWEPFQGRYEEVGADGFDAAWLSATGTLHFSGRAPVFGGSLSAGPAALRPPRFWTLSLTLQRSSLDDAAWRDALRRTVIELSDRLPAFYATAEVTRGHLWRGRTLWSDRTTESAVLPIRQSFCNGLSPTPVWWTWLGEPYADAAATLPADRATSTEKGVLFESSVRPLARDELMPLDRVLDPDLFARLAPNPDGRGPEPLFPAPTIPSRLTDDLLDRARRDKEFLATSGRHGRPTDHAYTPEDVYREYSNILLRRELAQRRETR
ncbi:MAG: hypothetical protein QM658_15365 [Gordonia sp. (in: high G+C Gram-positive bacteria)]